MDNAATGKSRALELEREGFLKKAFDMFDVDGVSQHVLSIHLSIHHDAPRSIVCLLPRQRQFSRGSLVRAHLLTPCCLRCYSLALSCSAEL